MRSRSDRWKFVAGQRALAAFLIPALLVLSACGDSDTEAPTPPAPIPEAPAAAVVPPAPAEAAPAAAVPAITPPVADAVPTPPEPVPATEPVAPAVDLAAAPPPVPDPAPTQPPVQPAAPDPVSPAAPAPVPPETDRAAIAAATDAALVARLEAADADAGRTVAARCSACHSFEANAANGVGPNLYDIVGAPLAAVPGFTYSPAFVALAASGAVWTYDLLDAFLASPSVTVPGTRMGFGGISDEGQRANLIAWLRTLSEDPVPLPGEPAADPMRAAIIALGLNPVVFTAEQAQIGHDGYLRNCATCHGNSFQGVFYGAEWGQAPPLIGDRFEQRWFLRPVGDLVAAIENTDILNYASLHQGLSADRYVAIAAYLLEQYGFTAGDVPLPVDPDALRTIGFWQ